MLKAADTIGEMKTTATAIGTHIQGIISTCRYLNEQQLIGFKTNEKKPATDQKKKHFYGCAVQVKLLIQMPRLLSTSLDNADFFVAAQLFKFCRHINVGKSQQVM